MTSITAKLNEVLDDFGDISVVGSDIQRAITACWVKIRAARNVAADTEDEIERLRAENANLHDLVQKLRGGFELQNRNGQLEEENAKLRQMAEDQRQQTARLHERVCHLAYTCGEHKKVNSDLHAICEEHRKRANKLSDENTGLQSLVQHHNGVIDIQAGTIAHQRAEIDRLNGQKLVKIDYERLPPTEDEEMGDDWKYREEFGRSSPGAPRVWTGRIVTESDGRIVATKTHVDVDEADAAIERSRNELQGIIAAMDAWGEVG